jgi:TonB family protein
MKKQTYFPLIFTFLFFLTGIILFSSFQNDNILYDEVIIIAQKDTIPDQARISVDVEQDDKIYMIVDEMPLFPGCANEETKSKKSRCSDEKIVEYIYKNVKYPAEAKKNKTEGMVIVEFIIDTDGSVINAKILRDVGDGCGEEALRIIHAMNDLPEKWIPGKKEGKPVKVSYNLPVKFKLG